MPRNGSGGYTQPVADFVPNTLIDAADVNSWFDDLGNEIANSLAKDGQTTPTANLPMGGFRFTGMGAPVNPADSVRRQDGWYLIQQQIASSVAQVDFVFPAGFSMYRFEWQGVRLATDGSAVVIRTSTNGGSSYDAGGSDYARVAHFSNVSGGTVTAASAPAEGGFFITLNMDNANAAVSCEGEMMLWPGDGTRVPTFRAASTFFDNVTGLLLYEAGGIRQSATQVNALRFLTSGGNIATGTFTLLGRL